MESIFIFIFLVVLLIISTLINHFASIKIDELRDTLDNLETLNKQNKRIEIAKTVKPLDTLRADLMVSRSLEKEIGTEEIYDVLRKDLSDQLNPYITIEREYEISTDEVIYRAMLQLVR